jgi:polysaccharide export outer membrane protein
MSQKVRKYLFPLFGVLMLALLFQSCRLLYPNRIMKVDGDDYPTPKHETETEQYVIQPFDQLEITVMTNEGWSMMMGGISPGAGGSGGSGGRYQQQMARGGRGMSYEVEYDGLVKMPVLGRVKLDGLTIRQAEDYIEKLYAQYYKKPYVKINVQNRRVYVFMGSTASAITITYDEYNMLDALIDMGGLPDNSKSYNIKLIRGDIHGDPQVYEYNMYTLEDIRKTNILLQPNDIIYVETRIRYSQRLISEINIYLSVFSTGLLLYGLFFK